ncbi:DOPA-like domain-containing protein [Rhodocollybia butyracea]|uniref:DOPA-like domain-containing protein n=1 Tax=Rhodocollybia butyracea TaxID=206335 RepID=A0A9P5UD23_9AGAR|nr:DOPA-like domain-containing protein [Rhodocollybia butyracea]
MDVDSTSVPKPTTNLQEVIESEIKEWHFHIYFAQKNADQHYAALELRDSILRLRRDGAFVAVPLFRVNTEPVGPHPIGSFEVWVPSETFASVFSYICMNRGNLSVLVHPLTREPRRDYESRCSWLGMPLPLDLTTLPIKVDELPLQYPSLRLGYSSQNPNLVLDDRRRLGANVENILRNEKAAARVIDQ